MSILVSQVMTTPAITVRGQESLQKIRTIIKEKNIHHVFVVDEAGLLAGLVSESDIFKELSPFLGTSVESRLDRATLEKTAWQLMTPNPVTIKPNQPIQDAAERLLQSKVSCLPVVDLQHKPVGALSWRDIMRVISRAGKGSQP